MVRLAKTRSVLKRVVKSKFKKVDTSKRVEVKRSKSEWEEKLRLARINGDTD